MEKYWKNLTIPQQIKCTEDRPDQSYLVNSYEEDQFDDNLLPIVGW